MRFGDWGQAYLRQDGMWHVSCRVCQVRTRADGRKAFIVGKVDGGHREAQTLWREHETGPQHQASVMRKLSAERESIRVALPVLKAIDEWAGTS